MHMLIHKISKMYTVAIRKKTFFHLLTVVVCVFFLSACETSKFPVNSSEDESLSQVPPTDTSTALPAATVQVTAPPLEMYSPIAMFESGEIQDLQFTVDLVELDEQGGTLLKPSEGNIFWLVHLTIENLSSSPYQMSSLMILRLTDSQMNQTWGVTLNYKQESSLDKTIQPGEVIQGIATFEVPISQKECLLQVKPDLLVSDELIFTLEPSVLEVGPGQPDSPDDEEETSKAESVLVIGNDLSSNFIQGEIDNFVITLLSTSFDKDSNSVIQTLSKGYGYLEIELSVVNNNITARSISTLPNIDLSPKFILIDEDGIQYEPVINPNIANSLDGILQPGESLEGIVSFAIPNEYGTLTLQISLDNLPEQTLSFTLE